MDIAMLGLRIENGQAIQAAKELDLGLKDLGKTADGVQSPFDRMTKKIEDSRVKFEAWKRQLAQTKAASDHITSVNRMTEAHELSFKGMGRLTNSLESFAAHLAGVHPVIGKVTTVLTELGVGGPVTLGVVAGVAAIVFAYEKLTEASRKVEEASNKAFEAVGKMLRAQRLGVGADMQTNISAMQAQEAALRAGIAGGEKTPEAAGMKKLLDDKRADLAALVKQEAGANVLLAQLRAADSHSQGATYTSNLAMLIQNNRDNQQYRQAGLKLLADDQKKLSIVQQVTPNDLAAAAMWTQRIKELHDAIYPKVKEESFMKRFADELKNSPLFHINLGGGVSSAIDQQLLKNPTLAGLSGNQPRNGYLDDLQKVYDTKAEADAKYRAQQKQYKDEAEARDRAAAQKYADDMRDIWRQGIGKIITDGTKSFRDFFEDVLQMFSRMMARMAQEGKANGGMYKALGVGSAAITGAFAGYQIGQQQGSASGGGILGGIGGAAAGFEIAGPLGAVVGGLTGLAAGLIGGASAARAYAESLKQAAKQVAATIADLHDLAVGTSGSLDSQIRHAREQFDQARTTATAASVGHGTWWQSPDGIAALAAQLSQLTADEAAYIERLKQEQAIKNKQFSEDLQVRLLRAQGQDVAANALALKLQQQREYDAAVKAGADAATLAFLQTVQAAETLKKVSDDLNTSVRNTPSGFKIESYINRYGAGKPWGIGGPLTTPFSPRGGPTRTGGSGGQTVDLRGSTINLLLPKGIRPEDVGPAFMEFLRSKAGTTVGGNVPLADVLDWA